MFARTPHLFHGSEGEENGTERANRHFDAPFAKQGWFRLGVAVRTIGFDCFSRLRIAWRPSCTFAVWWKCFRQICWG